MLQQDTDVPTSSKDNSGKCKSKTEKVVKVWNQTWLSFYDPWPCVYISAEFDFDSAS
jgi:hypothetical protein